MEADAAKDGHMEDRRRGAFPALADALLSTEIIDLARDGVRSAPADENTAHAPVALRGRRQIPPRHLSFHRVPPNGDVAVTKRERSASGFATAGGGKA